MEVTKLRVLHMEEPLGIDRNPYFSWKLESQQNDTVQSTYHITVREQDSDKIVWDTGVQHGRANAFIPYGGAPLRSKTRYCWEVRVEDNHGGVSDATSYFETAFLNAGDWKADWVESALPIKKRGKGLGKQCPATMFRKSFFVDGNVQKARLYATCHGVYRLTVNGKKVDDREMAPEYSSYEKVLCYQVYDLTDMLEKGENVIGLYVGEGWYFCGETAMSPKALKESHAVLFQLEMELADGEKKMVLSDGGVKTSYGPVQSSDLFAGEVYDAREEKIGWDAPGYDDARWTPARPCKKQSYENLVAQLGEPVSCVRELPAIKHYVSPKGELIYDFGQNFAGKVRIHVDAPAGTEIRLDLFEVTDAQGNYFNSILSTQGVGAGADQAIRFVSNGTGQTYEPYFVFLGFRYARLTGAEQARSIELTGLSLSSRMEETGTFSCSDARLNQLYSNIRWSQRSNMLSIPTDCPQREKAGWTGDISIYAETSLLNEDATAFLTRWLSSLRADQHENGAVPMVVPFNHTYQKMMKLLKFSGGNHGSVGIAGWGDASVTVPYTMYKVTGNKEVLAENYDTMKRWCDYILQSAKRKGDKAVPKEEEQWLWNTGFHYGEWLIPSISKAGMTDGKSMMKMMGTAQYTAPICGYRSIREMSEIAGILDREEDAAYYADVASHMKRAIGTYLIRQDGKLRWEYMGAYVMLLAFDLVPEPEKEAVVSHLVQMIHDNGDCLDTGFLATPFLLDVLSKNGHEDLAYRLLLQTKAPSWLYEVEHGATTIWENWFGYKEDGNPQIVSMNHYSFGVVADWMFRNICGIRREEAGFLRFRIQPRPVSSLTFASRTFETENGMIKTEWKRENGTFTLQAEVPCNTTAVIVLPDGASHEVGSGVYTFSCADELNIE